MRPIRGCTLLLAALWSVACHARQLVTLDEVTALKPDRVWVTVGDQPAIVVSSPHVVGDTLAGYVHGRREDMSTATFKQVFVQRPAPARTVLLVASIAIGAGVMYVLTREDPTGVDARDVCQKYPTDPTCI